MVVRAATAKRGDRGPPRRGGVSAIVLAAGTSSRMGTPKPLVPLRGRSLLAHSLDVLRQSYVSEIVVVLGAEADRVRREVSLEGARVVLNPEYEQGMSTSIRAGLRAVPEAESVLVVLADQPLLSRETVNALLARQETTGARILVPTYRGVRGNPVLLHRSLSAEIEAVTGDVGSRAVVREHPEEVVEVPVDDPGILLDIDTPQDLRRVEGALAAGASLDGLVADRLHEVPRTGKRRPRRPRAAHESTPTSSRPR